MSFALILMFLLMPSAVSSAAKDALDMCLVSVIPSLFPFMVAAKCAVINSGINEDNFLLRFIAKVFNIPLCGVWSFIFGLVCGYPIGAKTAFDLYRDGRLSKTDAIRLCCFANNAGPAFVIAVVGGGFLKSTNQGILIYICHIAGSIITGLALRFTASENSAMPQKREVTPIFSAIPQAVSDSVSGILNVSGIIIFFAVLSTALEKLLPMPLPGGELGRALFYGIFEMTSGIKLLAVSAISLRLKKSLICFLIGFSGISVIFQTKAFIPDKSIKITPCIICKVLSAILSAILIAIF